jgi:dienelactone hydrolase
VSSPPTQQSTPSQNVRFVQLAQRALSNPEAYHAGWHHSSTGRSPSPLHYQGGRYERARGGYAGSGLAEGRLSATIAVALGAAILLGSPLSVVAEDPVQLGRCIRMLRVTGVAQDDVLYLRTSPHVPDPSEPDNKSIGIPPEARRIEEVGGAEVGWQHIRYVGLEGYASSRYLASDTIDCPDAVLTRADQPGSTRQSGITPVITFPESKAARPGNGSAGKTPPMPVPVPSSTTTASIQAVDRPAVSSALRTTVEEGYRIEEGFFKVTIGASEVLLQGLIVKKADAAGKLPIMLYTHGSTPSMEKRQEMSPRGPKDVNLRLVRDYARRGWLGVFVLRRAYGQSDGPDPVTAFKCDTSTPSFQDGMDAAADDLEATLSYIGRREDADPSRVMALGVSGGGGAVVALSARDIPGLKVVVNISGGFALLNCDRNSDRLTEAMRYYGARSKIPNLWYYAKTDIIFPEQTVVKMRAAFLEGGAYAKLVHYPTLAVAPSTDGHQLWSKQTSMIMIMLDVDGFLRQHSLPTWDYGEARALVEKHGIKRWAYSIELYAAAPGYKALAKSTTGDFVANVYAAHTPELAKERAIALCQERHVGHTCKVIDPPESRADK